MIADNPHPSHTKPPLGSVLCFLLFFVFFAVGMAFAQTSTPQGLAPSSGSVDSGFSSAGEGAAGATSNSSYTNAVGFVAAAFAPLIPADTGDVASLEGITAATIAYPSPFNPAIEVLTIAYQHTKDETINIYIMDIAGVVIKQIRTNSATTRAADGYSRATWDGAGAATGVYLIQVIADNKIVGRTKVILIKT